MVRVIGPGQCKGQHTMTPQNNLGGVKIIVFFSLLSEKKAIGQGHQGQCQRSSLKVIGLLISHQDLTIRNKVRETGH